MKPIIVGTLESSDCMITLTKHDKTVIDIDSVVADMFGDAICEVIKQTLLKHHFENAHVIINDKGALDYTIEARLETAILRYKEVHDES